ncbi:hypothetical protein R3P38DRAFT_3299366 [Favolaschia claudopus]|uniref:NADH:flavin oxidoreductase/NADH oxidase N-terminal domain-containing protein n=1 Tax=Favolaschia claudopus TaxID=2862362 RepID=A0AAV9Z123_9AGAR
MPATPAIPKLFTPIQLNSDIRLQHRVVHAPMTRFRVDGETGVILPIVKEYYTQRASTPGTLLISEGTVFAKKGGGVYIPFTPENAGRFTGVAHGAWPGMWSAEQAAAWKEPCGPLPRPCLRNSSLSSSAHRESIPRVLQMLSADHLSSRLGMASTLFMSTIHVERVVPAAVPIVVKISFPGMWSCLCRSSSLLNMLLCPPVVGSFHITYVVDMASASFLGSSCLPPSIAKLIMFFLTSLLASDLNLCMEVIWRAIVL